MVWSCMECSSICAVSSPASGGQPSKSLPVGMILHGCPIEIHLRPRRLLDHPVSRVMTVPVSHARMPFTPHCILHGRIREIGQRLPMPRPGRTTMIDKLPKNTHAGITRRGFAAGAGADAGADSRRVGDVPSAAQ